MNDSPSMLRATLIGGATFGAIAALPFIGALNCACCALVVGAGFFASYLYSQECSKQGAAFSPGAGAMVGLVAGMFYALTNTIVGGILNALLGMNIEETLRQIEDLGVEIPPDAEAFFEFLINANPLLLLFLGFCLSLLVAAVFSTLGGLIGGAAFKVEPPAPTAGGTPPPIVDVEPGGGPSTNE
jgi:hypothetical protein